MKLRVVAGRPYTPRSDELPYGPGSEDYEYDGWRQEQVDAYTGPERRADWMVREWFLRLVLTVGMALVAGFVIVLLWGVVATVFSLS